MIQDALQQRIHGGDRDAFREIYGHYSREVYALAHSALGDADRARAVVKQVFLQLYRELMQTDADVDLPARLSALTNEEVRITRISMGDLSPDALQVQYTLATSPSGLSADPLVRVRMRMAQQSAAEASSAAFAQQEPVQDAAPAAQTAESAFEAEAARAASIASAALADDDDTAVLFAEDALLDANGAQDASDFFLAGNDADDAANDRSAADPAQPAGEPAAPAAPESAAPQPEAPVQRAAKAKKKRRGLSGGAIACIIVLSLFLLLFVWLLIGILMDLSVLRFTDLGYSWFNANVFPFFNMAGN